MSALRVPGPNGTVILRVIDDGAVGRVTHSRLGIKGGSVQGAYVVGVSRTNAQNQREYKQREAEKARAATR